ncbi:M23 family metallopeptidase [Curtobacterium ammoniigenes]|uniref:M23 family metallopeptidase n=1 Tax=Curtobacterium ammoniigenes TaxID=395387 RepID=UPI000831A40C|nr:M23 family metallopeptidase [Curtobacterium ammoniigenes]
MNAPARAPQQSALPQPAARRARPRLALALAIALLAGTGAGTAAAIAGPAAPANATTYPSWADVQAAKASQAAQAAKVSEIQGLISSLQSNVQSTQAAEQAAGQAYQNAQTQYDEQALRERTLQAQADDAAASAKRAEERAGQLAAELSRASGTNVTAQLLAHPSSSNDMLYQLGAISKLTEQSNGVYEQAVEQRNAAQSLSDQAAVAERQLGTLKDAAQQKMQAATSAASSAQTALSAQNDNEQRLQAQLTLLTTNATDVQANYEKGVEVARAEAAARAAAIAKAAAEARAAAAARAAQQQAAAQQAAAAARAAAAAAAAQSHTASSKPQSSGSTPAPPVVSQSSGWVRPAGGVQSSPYGYRIDPYTHQYALHAGVDLAPGCGAPIVAAASGTVTFAANGGGYGNEVIIDHGAGISTAYGHIVNGGFLVSAGQHVVAGQQIALVGSTGWSTGCHLHFETRVNGAAVDPVPFMAARGVSV